MLRTKLFYGWILLVALTSCKSTHPTIFINQVCSPPCWENIQPGTTPKQDAFELLSRVSLIDKETITFRGGPTLIFDDELFFGFKSGDGKGIIYILDGKVADISFSGNLGITLGEVFEKLGEPEYVVNIPVYGGPPLQGTMRSGIQLINSKVGYGLIYFTEDLPTNRQNKIIPEITPTVITYFDPRIFDKFVDAGLFSFRQLNGADTRFYMKPWSGYGEINQKYPPATVK